MGCTFGYKACVVFLSLLQLVVAIALMAAGIAVFVTFGHINEFAQAFHTLVPASILIAAGVLLIVLACFGCFGAVKENKCLLAIFFILCGAIFVLEMVGACVALAMRGDFETAVQNEFKDFMKKSANSSSAADEVNWIQTTFQCCGSVNVTDWANLNLPVPNSCCNSTIVQAKACNESTVQYVTGCQQKLHDVFFSNLNIIGGVGLGFALIQLFALIGVMCLLCRNKHHYDAF